MKYTVKLPRQARVLLLEDSDERINWFLRRFASPKDCKKCVVARTANEAIAAFAAESFDFVFLDHDLGLLDYTGGPPHQGDGKQVARFMSGRGFLGDNVVIHSWNPSGAAAMKDILIGASAIPFGKFEIEFEG